MVLLYNFGSLRFAFLYIINYWTKQKLWIPCSFKTGLDYGPWTLCGAQSCLTLCDPVDCSLPDFSVHGIFQARILERVAISHSRGSSRPRDRAHVSWVSCSGRLILYHCATWEGILMLKIILLGHSNQPNF